MTRWSNTSYFSIRICIARTNQNISTGQYALMINSFYSLHLLRLLFVLTTNVPIAISIVNSTSQSNVAVD